MSELNTKQKKAWKLVILYPFVLVIISLLINLIAFDVNRLEFVAPGFHGLCAFSIAAILLCINHSYLMTATELTRVKYKMYATPEEWEASGTRWTDISEHAKRELERAHNAHRNSNENTLYFLVLSVPFVITAPSAAASYIWFVGFALARLGHAVSYLKGSDNWRGVFMSIGLLAMYGVATHLLVAMISSM